MNKVMLIIGLLVITVGVMNLFPQINFRKMPEGLIEGHLPEKNHNWVSSRVSPADSHYIAPLKIKSLDQLSECIKNKFSQVEINHTDKFKIIAFRRSRVFHFVDWLCIHADGAVTSSATMGYSDFGKNRELVEQIKKECC